MPDVSSLDIGGGFKIHRYGDEHEADMAEIASVFASELTAFAERTGRQLQLEIEPGTWLVGHAGVLLAEVADIVDTGVDGHVFLRLNTGMNDIIRPSMYGAQHEIAVRKG
jgi:diaminopimelate decarboxylase